MARRGEEVHKDPNNPADFTGGPIPGSPEAKSPIYVDPGVDHAASAYAAGMQARQQRRKAGGLTKTNVLPGAAGGVPEKTNIPRLDGPHQEGQTMQATAEQQQFEALRQAQMSIAAGQMPAAPGGSIIEQGVPSPAPAQRSPAAMGILPGDILPEAATKDERFIQGAGSMTAAAQPGLALKYGVVRKGRHVAPQQLNPQQRQLRPETLRDLEQLKSLQQQQLADSGLPQSEKEAQAGMPEAARASAKVGDPRGQVENKPMTESEKKETIRRIDNMDEFDLDEVQQRMMRDILQNQDQRDIVEERLDELTIDALILHNRIEQMVPIVPGKFFPTFQSVSGQEDLALKRIIMEEATGLDVSDRYLIDKYSMMGIALGVSQLNGKPMGTHEDAEGNFSDDLFKAKFNRVVKLPTHMLASLGAHYFWFEQRVRKLFVAEKVGNG